MNRATEILNFLSSTGWAGARRTPLAGDASARRYERIALDGAGCLLMDVPPESGLATVPYLGIADWLLNEGFSAPKILAADRDAGLVLVEDFGDGLFAGLCRAEPWRERDLYFAAVDVLLDLQQRHLPMNTDWTPPPYDMSVLMREAGLLLDWYLALAQGKSPDPQLCETYLKVIERTFAAIPDMPRVPVMRDYHAENLIWLPDRSGTKKVGLLDFQDMLIGNPAYDLVSLLDDARRDVDETLREELLNHYLAVSHRDPDVFMHAASTLSTQRNLKILGLFTRLCRRDGKSAYLEYLPRVWAHLQRNLTHPALKDLSTWINNNVPAPDANVRNSLRQAAA